MLIRLRNSKFTKWVSLKLVLAFCFNIFGSSNLFALTSGPTQPEFQKFMPISQSELVNKFTGDFAYNIPLMDVDGYPLNIFYDSNVGMEQEASWVGLGWDLNVGSISRSMRGLPDDFSGENIIKELSMRDNVTYGLGLSLSRAKQIEVVGVGLQPAGGGSWGLNLGLSYNSYSGYKVEHGIKLSLNSPAKWDLGGGIDFDINASNQGLELTPTYSTRIKGSGKISANYGARLNMTYSSRLGLTNFNISKNASFSYKFIKLSASNRSSYTPVGLYSVTPHADFPMKHASLSGSFSIGQYIPGWSNKYGISGFWSKQSLEANLKAFPSYGFMYAHNSDQNNFHVLNDFNRINDGQFRKHTKFLPVTNHTFDLFSIAGHGIDGSFRAHRNDVGKVFDPIAEINSISGGNLGVELMIGGGVQVGIDLSIAHLNAYSGNWRDNNDVLNSFKYSSGNGKIEPFYFKMSGEKNKIANRQVYDAMKTDEAVCLNIEGKSNNKKQKLKNELLNKSRGSLGSVSATTNTDRNNRNNLISYLTLSEAKVVGVQKDLYSSSSPNGICELAKGYHIAELSVLNDDGVKYVYGLPTYNIKDVEKTFAVDNSSVSNNENLVSYNDGIDNSIVNKKGLDNYYSSSTIPSYAYGYNLTAILSSDYVDYDNINGPSDGDLGNYTKFSYKRHATNYKWRSPITSEEGKASYIPGFKAVSFDNKGAYRYGEKELWYTEKIETKNQIAIFYTSHRKDAVESKSEKGGLNTSGTKSLKLDSIKLFSKIGYENNPNNAVCIKSVHFEYNYSLCNGVPNFAGNSSEGTGKLTLNAIYFKYGNSRKAKLSPYKFEYQTGGGNPNYAYGSTDRWGTYKPNNAGGVSILNNDFPYSFQPENDYEKQQADQYASVWLINRIMLPSGGEINIEYESDDYAYIQDKRASEMTIVAGINAFPMQNASLPSLNNNLASLSNGDVALYFPLRKKIINTNYNIAKNEFKKLYLPDQPIYYKFLVDIRGGNEDYVSGYFNFSNYGLAYSSNSSEYDYAWVKFDPKKTKDRDNGDDINPIQKDAIQFGRLNLPSLIWDGYNNAPNGSSLEDMLNAIANSSMLGQIDDFIKKPVKKLKQDGCGQLFNPAKSFIRLKNPDGKKLGGGARVKKMLFKDNWLGNSATPDYGQTYSYTINSSEFNGEISSGVASYEPLIGGDENSFRTPNSYAQEVTGGPDYEFYQEEPIGEEMFPSPVVGYSYVKVENIFQTNPSDLNNTHNPRGYSEFEFFTAKDFPIRTDYTPLKTLEHFPNPWAGSYNFNKKTVFSATQGYVIETNDMHGKLKSQKNYRYGTDNAISYIIYHYKTNPNDAKRLNSKFKVVSKSGTISETEIGMEYDIITDFRNNKTSSTDVGAEGNVMFTPPFIFLLSIVPSFFKTNDEFNCAVVTKNIQRYGLVEKIESYSEGQFNVTEFLVLDEKTGEPVVTRNSTLFEDKSPNNTIDGENYYDYTIPAYWAYNSMSQASENYRAKFSLNLNQSGTAFFSGAKNMFHEGDEIKLNLGLVGWVIEVNDNSIRVIDKSGAVVSGSYDNATIIRSGYRNLCSAMAATYKGLTSPITGNNLNDIYNDLLSASAVTYSQNRRTQCGGIQLPPLNPPSSQTIYSVTPFAQNLISIMNNLIQSGNLYGSSIPLYNAAQGVYYNGASPLLTDYFGSSYDLFWNGHLVNTVSPIGYFEIYSTQVANHSVCCHFSIGFPDRANNFNVENFSPINFGDFDPSSNMIKINYQYLNSGVLAAASTYIEPENNCDLIVETQVINTNQYCGLQPGNAINPYVTGIKGNWQPLTSYVLNNERFYDNNALKLRNDGRIKNSQGGLNITPFYTSNNGSDWTKNESGWTAATTVTLTNQLGDDLESKDALGIYSSAVYGYNNTLPICLAGNARYNEIGSDNFEDYDYFASMSCPTPHLSFYPTTGVTGSASISSERAHTGKYSLKVNGGYTSSEPNGTWVKLTREVSPNPESETGGGVPYLLKDIDCIKQFKINSNASKEFIMSYWVSVRTANTVLSYDHAKIKVYLNSTETGVLTKGKIIDGWQQHQVRFTIPASFNGLISFKAVNAHLDYMPAYFDDFRVQPLTSSMKSYVYLTENQRFVSELDNNNYATFYDYDEEGVLIRVKKETERGIMTIKENRTGKSKKNAL